MSGSISLGKIFGIPIQVHYSWTFIFIIIALSLATAYLPVNFPGWSTGVYWAIGLLGSALLFASVLVHELSHSIVAIHRGHKVRSITLFLLGGVSQIEEEAARPKEEFLIAVVGPITSFLLSAFFWGLYFGLSSVNSQIEALTLYLGTVNLFLGAFNLIPAFPLDGGRVLRSIIWSISGSQTRGNTVATNMGVAIGIAFIILGILLSIYTRSISGLWLSIIGWFLQSAASASKQQYAVRSTLSGKRVLDAMRHDFPKVLPGITAQQLVDEHMLKEYETAYVVMLGDSFQGLVTVSDFDKIPARERPHTWVTAIMTRKSEVDAVTPTDSLEEALKKMAARGVDQLVVLDGDRVVGLLTRTGVSRVLEIAGAFPDAGDR